MNETLIAGITNIAIQGINELGAAQVSFGLKVCAIFGLIYLCNMALRSGGSVIHMLIYVIGFIKWVVYKILKKDV